ncbi:transmembrane protein, putative (macronuclear) [Tetrahymena thermophila SB210]|uniref:Transmembrane protein, putative n=1 Tax=Tetrahymena thermophila (strain SB210) TaxID=312017 RepID=Q22EZ6_TETTS|nr:transmembrane protein, putative [Tetrahymena thermophila SB210]EAR83879.2 transmembrane protein, putative [Tetrahymena thermophila SB210]|eukprot:XP_001031542.2 transmembrane protein, putative [Tetrahymena thermophila SB210]
MSKYIKLILVIFFNLLAQIRAQYSQFCLATDPVGNCLKCSEGFLVDQLGYCVSVCPYSFQYYSFIKKQCVFVCETGYQENSSTSLCEEILQCPKYISQGQMSHVQEIRGIRVYQDQWILSFSSDKLILWKVENSRIMLISDQYQEQNQIFDVQFSNGGQYFYSFSAKQVIIWSVSDFQKIAIINLNEDDDVEIKQGFVKFVMNTQQNFLNYFVGFSDSLHKIAVLVVYSSRSFDEEYNNYNVIQILKAIPIQENLKSVEIFGNGSIYGLTALGNLLFWDVDEDSPSLLVRNILLLNLNLNFSLVQNKITVFNGTALELLNGSQLLIVNATSLNQQVVVYSQPDQTQSIQFKQYVFNYYLNETYLIDSEFIYIYNMTNSQYLIKQYHNLSIANQPISLELSLQGNYLLIELNNTSYIYERFQQGNYQGNSNQTSNNEFIFQNIIQDYEQIKTTNKELIWVSKDNQIVAKQLVKEQNNSSTSLLDAFILKNIAEEQIIVPKNDSQPQDLVYFDDFYVISFAQSLYVWSYKDHTLLYTINFDNPGNNFLKKLPNDNELLIFRDLSCTSLIIDCFSSIEIFQLGINYATKKQSVANLKTDFYAKAVNMINSNLYVLTSTQNIFLFILSNQYQLINQNKIYATKTKFNNAASYFQQNYLINIFKSQAVIEAIDLQNQNVSSIFYQIKYNVQINSFFYSTQSQALTINLVNNTLLILHFNQTGFLLLSQKDNLEERVLLSAYDIFLNRLVIIQGTQIVTYDESRKMVISKEWTPVYYQIAEKPIFIQTKSIHIIAFQINRQALVIFDVYSYKVLHTYEFYSINQLSFMKFNEKNNILHLTWVNKTHSYLQIENPFKKALFQNQTKFDQKGFTSQIQQTFQANDILFDYKTGVAVKIDYFNQIIICLDIANEAIIQIYFLQYLSQDCFFIPKYGMIISENKFTNKLFVLYYYNSSNPVETQYLVDKSFVDKQSLNNIKPIITEDQNYLIILTQQNITQIELSSMKIVNQVNISQFFTYITNIESTLTKNILQIRGYYQYNTEYQNIQYALLTYNLQNYTIMKYNIYQNWSFIILKEQTSNSDHFIGISNKGVSVNSLSKNIQYLFFSLENFISFKIISNYLVVQTKTDGLILNLQDYSLIDEWSNEQDTIQQILYIDRMQLIVKKKQSSVYISQAYTGMVLFLLPIQFSIIDFIYLDIYNILVLQMSDALLFIDLIAYKQIQQIAFSCINLRMFYIKYFNAILMIDKNSNSIFLFSYDIIMQLNLNPASNNQKQIMIGQDSSIYISDDDFQLWQFSDFEYQQKMIQKFQGPIQYLSNYKDNLLVIADQSIRLYNSQNQNTGIQQSFPILLDEQPYLFTNGQQQVLFFVGRQSIRKLDQNIDDNLQFNLTQIFNQQNLVNSTSEITSFTYSFSIQTPIFSDNKGSIYFKLQNVAQIVLNSNEIISQLKYLDSINCLLIQSNTRLILYDFSYSNNSQPIINNFQQIIYNMITYKDSIVIVTFDYFSIKFLITKISNPKNQNNSSIQLVQVNQFINPTYYPHRTSTRILNDNFLAIYSSYQLNLYDNINNLLIFQVQTETQIIELFYQDNLLFISTNQTLFLLCLEQQNQSNSQTNNSTYVYYSYQKFSQKQFPIQKSVILKINTTFYTHYFYMESVIKNPKEIRQIKFYIKFDPSQIYSDSQQDTYVLYSDQKGLDFFEYNKQLNFCYIEISSNQKLYQITQAVQTSKNVIDYYYPDNKNSIQIIYQIGQPLPYILSQFQSDQFKIKFIPSQKQDLNLAFVNGFQPKFLSIQGFNIQLKSFPYNFYTITYPVKTVIFDSLQFERVIMNESDELNYPVIYMSNLDAVILHNITIYNQSLGYGNFFRFQSILYLEIKNVTIKRSTLTNTTLFNIFEIDQVFIENVVFEDIDLVDFSSLMIIQKVVQLSIKNINIINTKQISGSLSIQDLINLKIQQTDLNLNLVNIFGVQSTVIDTALIQNNLDTQFLSYQNIYFGSDAVIFLQKEMIKLINLNLTGNYNTQNYVAAIYIKSSQISIKNSTFTKNNCTLCYRGTLMYIFGSNSFKLKYSNMSENVGMMGSALFVEQTNITKIHNCIFEQNKALSFGGALYLQYVSNTTFQETLIQNNVADIGGGIYYNSFYNQVFDNVTLINNTASIYGQNIGSYPKKIVIQSYQSSSTPFNSENKDNLNRNLQVQNYYVNQYQSRTLQSQYEEDQLQQIDDLVDQDISNINWQVQSQHVNRQQNRILQSQYLGGQQQQTDNNVGYFNQSMEIINFRSGDFLNLEIQMFDEEGKLIYLQKGVEYYHEQSIKLLQTFIILVNPEDKDGLKISGKNQINIQNASPTDGLWRFNELKIIGHPNLQNKYFRIVMGQIKQYDMYNYLQSKNFLITNYPTFEVRVAINFRSCLKGEIYNCDEDNQFCTCTPCAKGSYSLQIYNDSKSRQICELCPNSAELCQKDQIFLKQGYWRISKDTDNIVYCYNKPSNCLGNLKNETLAGDLTCIEGHIGPLCESCDTYGILWKKSYMRLSDYKCISCSELNDFTSVLPFIMIFTIMAAYIIFSIRVTIHLSKRYVYSYYFKKFGIVHIGVSNTKNQAQFYVKQFMHYIQIAVIVNSYDFNVPYLTEYVPYLISSPLKNTIYSFDCVFAYFVSIPIVYFRSIWSLIVPFFYLVTITIIYLSIYIMKKPKRYNKFYIYNGLLFMLVLFQPGIVSSLFYVISCRQIADKYYISADVTYECYTKQYFQYLLLLMIPGIILWGVAIPFFILKNIYNNKSRLDLYEVKLKFGFLYVDYKKQYYYWEFIKIYKKVIIMVISIMCEGIFYTKLILICAIIISYLVFCIKRQPYLIKSFNDFDLRITLALFVLILINLFLYNKDDSIVYDFFIYVCAFLHNGILFVLVLQILVTKIKNRYVGFFYKLFFRLKKLIPSLFNFINIQPPIDGIRSSSNWRKVQIAKDVIVQNIQKGNHITSVEQLRRPYQDYIQQLQMSLISVIKSKKNSKSNQEIGQSTPSISKLKRLTEFWSNMSPVSVKAQKRSILESKKRELNSSQNQSKSIQNIVFQKQNMKKPKSILDFQTKHFNLSKINSSETQYANPLIQMEQNQPFNMSKQNSNLVSAQKLEDNISSQTYLQKNSTPKSNKIFTLAQNNGKEQATAQNNNQFSLLQNSINVNQMHKSIYQYSAQNLQDDTNIVFFNSGVQLSPLQMKGQEFNYQYSSQKWSPLKQMSPKHKKENNKDSQKEQQFIQISSSSGEEQLSESSISSYCKSEQSIQEDYIKDNYYRDQRSKSLGESITNKQSDVEINSCNTNSKQMSSPQFERKNSLQICIGQSSVAKNQDEKITSDANFINNLRIDLKNIPEKSVTLNSQRFQVRQDSLFSFQYHEKIPSVPKYKFYNSQLSNKLNSQDKIQNQNQIQFNFDKQNLDLGDSLETMKHFQSTQELQKNIQNNQLTNTEKDQNQLQHVSVKNEPYQTQQIKRNISELKRQTSNQSKNQILEFQNESNLRLSESIQLDESSKAESDKQKQVNKQEKTYFQKD